MFKLYDLPEGSHTLQMVTNQPIRKLKVHRFVTGFDSVDTVCSYSLHDSMPTICKYCASRHCPITVYLAHIKFVRGLNEIRECSLSPSFVVQLQKIKLLNEDLTFGVNAECHFRVDLKNHPGSTRLCVQIEDVRAISFRTLLKSLFSKVSK